MGFDLGQQYFKFLKGGAKQEEDDEVQTMIGKCAVFSTKQNPREFDDSSRIHHAEVCLFDTQVQALFDISFLLRASVPTTDRQPLTRSLRRPVRRTAGMCRQFIIVAR